MKTCQCCGTVSDAATCPRCGEASWFAAGHPFAHAAPEAPAPSPDMPVLAPSVPLAVDGPDESPRETPPLFIGGHSTPEKFTGHKRKPR